MTTQRFNQTEITSAGHAKLRRAKPDCSKLRRTNLRGIGIQSEIMEGQVIENTSKTARGMWASAWARLKRNKLAMASLVFICAMACLVAFGPPIWEKISGFSYDYTPPEEELQRSLPPSLKHPMGTDDQGRDLFARVLQGGRVSMMVGLIATIVSLVLGISYGAFSGFIGGWVDNLLMRIVDILYSIPYILIVIVLLSFFGGPNTPGWVNSIAYYTTGSTGQGLSQIFLLFFALGLVSWLTMARVVRGQVLSLKHQDFILAARVCGASDFAIVFKHLIPNTLGTVIVYATLTIPGVMLTEAFLSFLGLGVQPPFASWGSLVESGIKNLAIFPWQLIFPGLLMAATLFSLNFLGDGLRDAFDPRA